MVRNLPASAGDAQKRHGFGPWVGKISWSRKWQPTPVFLPGKFHGQRSLVGYSPWSHKESSMTEVLEHKQEQNPADWLPCKKKCNFYSCGGWKSEIRVPTQS